MKIIHLFVTAFFFLSPLCADPFEKLPDTVHYEAFNTNPLYCRKADLARAELIEQLKRLKATNVGTPPLHLGKSLVPSWKLDWEHVSDDQVICLGNGQFSLTAAELKAMNSTASVSYLSSTGIKVDDKVAVLSKERLCDMLTYGSRNSLETALAMYRLVASDAAIFFTSRLEPIKRTLNMPLRTVRIYTTNAPNLAYNYVHQKMFLNERKDRLNPLYKQVMKQILAHVFTNMQKDGIEFVGVPGFGQGAFVPDALRSQSIRFFTEALFEVLEEGSFAFQTVLVSDPSGAITFENRNNIQVTKKSLLDVCAAKSQEGIKTGMLNAGDPSCIAGQFWQGGHIALEELYALTTTMVLSQSPGLNPHLLEAIQKM